MIKILEFKENEDGSADISFEMSQDELKEFAKIGILKVLVDAANETIKQGKKK